MMNLIEEYLIDTVKDQSFIYDKREENYKNKAKKMHFFEALSVEISDLYHTDLTGKILLSFHTFMRNYYN